MEIKKKYVLLTLIFSTFFITGLNFSFFKNYPEDSEVGVVKKWQEIERFYKEGYLSVPTEKMAEKLFSLIPDEPAPASSGRLFSRLRFSRTLSIFHPEISLKLLPGPDVWDFSELLDGLSMLIRINPERFLEALHQQFQCTEQGRLSIILSFIPEAYYSTEAKTYLLQERMKALASVKSKELENIRERCLVELRSRLDQMQRTKEIDYEANVRKEGNNFRAALVSFVQRPDEIAARKLRDLVDLNSRDESLIASIISSLYFENQEPRFDTFSVHTGISGEEWLHKKEYFLLEYEILTGNRYAGELLARIWCLKEPASLRIMNALGYLAMINPDQYLEIISPYENKMLETFQEFPLSTFLNIFGEKSLRKLIDNEYLFSSMEKVNSEKYRRLKELCLRQILSSKEQLKLTFYEERFKAKKYENRYGEEISAYLSGQKTISSPAWKHFRERLAEFLNKPGENESQALLESIPESSSSSDGKDRLWSLYSLFNWPAFQAFKYQMMAGNLPAIRCAIRLLKHTKSVEQEVLLDTLSLLVRVNPGALLEAFYLESDDPFLRENGYPVVYDLELYRHSREAMTYELEMRERAIRSVKDKKLSQIKNQCQKRIREMIKKSSLMASSEKEKFIYRPPQAIEGAVKETLDLPDDRSMRNLKNVIKSYLKEGHEDLSVLLILSKKSSDSYFNLPSEWYLLIEREALAANREAIELLVNLYTDSYWFFKDVIKDSLSKVAITAPGLFFAAVSSVPEIKDKDVVEILSYIDRTRTFPRDTDRGFILKQRIKIIQKSEGVNKDRHMMKILEELKQVSEKSEDAYIARRSEQG